MALKYFLLPKVNEKLPLARHVTCTFQNLHLIEWLLAARYLMGAQKIVVGNPKRGAVNSTIVSLVAAGDTVGFLKGAVQAFNDLLERAVLLGNLIVIGKPYDLGD